MVNAVVDLSLKTLLVFAQWYLKGQNFMPILLLRKHCKITIPKLGNLKVRQHCPIPERAVLKSVQLIKKADGWYINLRLLDDSIPDFKSEITLTWDNSIGVDAVLHEDDYLATSEGYKLQSLKSFRKSKNKLAKVSRLKNCRRQGSKARRKLAKREAKIHQQIARARKDHAYNTANTLLATGKKVFFYEKLNLKGLIERNQPRQDEKGRYLPNGQSPKSGLALSWADAAFGQFFAILKYKGEKTGALVQEVNPAHTSQLLSYKDESERRVCGAQIDTSWLLSLRNNYK